jgi:hypothetical protein
VLCGCLSCQTGRPAHLSPGISLHLQEEPVPPTWSALADQWYRKGQPAMRNKRQVTVCAYHMKAEPSYSHLSLCLAQFSRPGKDWAELSPGKAVPMTQAASVPSGWQRVTPSSGRTVRKRCWDRGKNQPCHVTDKRKEGETHIKDRLESHCAHVRRDRACLTWM